jgi:hypothetical protein
MTLAAAVGGKPGIDPTEFSDGGRLYFVYSAYVGSHSDLIIARRLG